MSLYLPALLQAIQTRLSGDATLLTYLGTGAATAISTTFGFPAVDPMGTTYPRICIMPISETPDDPFKSRRSLIGIDVMIYAVETPQSGGTGANAQTSLATMLRIHERVMGDFPDQATSIPSYGLDWWTPDFTAQTGLAATTYASETMVFTGFTNETDIEGGLRCFRISFQVGLNKRSA